MPFRRPVGADQQGFCNKSEGQNLLPCRYGMAFYTGETSMRKILIFSFVLISCLASGLATAEEMAKEGTESYIMSYSGPVKILTMGKERVQMNYEGLGIYIGEGLLTNSTFRFMGALQIVKGAYDNDFGLLVFTTPEGHKAFAIYEAAGRIGAGGKGSYKYVGGTGKLAGLQGGGEFTRISLRPSAEETIQGYNKVNGHWKLPEPKK
jgi:hypothetical protein